MQKKSVKIVWFKENFISTCSTRELQTNLIFKRNENIKCKEISLSSKTPQTYLRILPIYGNIFEGKNFPKQYHALNTVFLQDPLW